MTGDRRRATGQYSVVRSSIIALKFILNGVWIGVYA
jgi:hypothetical protein